MQSSSPPNLRLLPKDALAAKRLLPKVEPHVPLSPQDHDCVLSCTITAAAALKPLPNFGTLVCA